MQGDGLLCHHAEAAPILLNTPGFEFGEPLSQRRRRDLVIDGAAADPAAIEATQS
jgi:hypothetical protein